MIRVGLFCFFAELFFFFFLLKWFADFCLLFSFFLCSCSAFLLNSGSGEKINMNDWENSIAVSCVINYICLFGLVSCIPAVNTILQWVEYSELWCIRFTCIQQLACGLRATVHGIRVTGAAVNSRTNVFMQQ